MAKRKHNPEAQAAKESWSKGVGLSTHQQPIAVRFPPVIDALLRAMSDRQAYIRAAVERQLKDDGLLKQEEK
ncbi:MAG: hypothetical protein KME27_31430 [Lyngbya sp. HA4199-MV5]|jgi:hypothetical protein|nr:hypothetical protein [Lyngbya sp. HA4199-MV5]